MGDSSMNAGMRTSTAAERVPMLIPGAEPLNYDFLES
jgi:hypothetical protein